MIKRQPIQFTHKWFTVLHQLHDFDSFLVLEHLYWYLWEMWVEILLCDRIVGT